MGSRMASAEIYRLRAIELSAEAKNETNPKLRAELENLALAYLRLAEHADHNGQNDVSTGSRQREKFDAASRAP